MRYFRSIPPPMMAVLALGAGNQLGQVLVLRELLMVFHGHELTIGMILAFWMGWEALGCWMGTRLSGRTGCARRLLTVLVTASVAILPLALLTIRMSRDFFSPVAGTHLSLGHTVAASLLLPAPVCMLLGSQFVVVARLWREHRGVHDVSGAVRAYMFEAAGHMAGGLLFSLVLVHVFSPLQIVAVLGVLLLGGLLALTSDLVRARRRLVIAMLLLLCLIPALSGLDARAFRWQWPRFMPDSRLVEVRQSKYGTIHVAHRRGQYSFFQSNHFMFSTGGAGVDGMAFEEAAAVHLAHLAMSQHHDPRRVLLIGGGMRGMLRELLLYRDVVIDYVELDAVLLDAAYPHLPAATRAALNSPRVHVLTKDGRLHMKTTERMYDVVVIDLPDPATAVLNRFYTREFFQEARGRMPPDGVLAIAAASTPGLRHFAVVNRNAALFHTLREVFADVLVGGEDMCLFFASGSDRSLTDDASVMAMRYREREVRSEDFTDQHFYTLLRDQTVRRKHWILSHHGRSARSALEPPDTGPLAPVPLREQQALLDGLPAVEHRFFLNSDFHPIGYFHTLIFLQSLQGGGGALLLRRLLRVRLWWIALVAAVVVAAGGMLRLRDDRRTRGSARRYAVSVSAFAIGFASMVFEVTLLFAFQGVYGYVFERIGLIVALFMGGLALGCGVSRRCMTGPSVLRSMVFIQMLFVAFSMLLAVGVPIAASWTTTPWIFAAFALVTLMAGMLNGLHYPPASAGRYHLSGHPERAAGFVYAVELFGACIGSVAASVVLVPVLGLLGACVTAGLVNAAACVVLWIADGA